LRVSLCDDTSSSDSAEDSEKHEENEEDTFFNDSERIDAILDELPLAENMLKYVTQPINLETKLKRYASSLSPVGIMCGDDKPNTIIHFYCDLLDSALDEVEGTAFSNDAPGAAEMVAYKLILQQFKRNQSHFSETYGPGWIDARTGESMKLIADAVQLGSDARAKAKRTAKHIKNDERKRVLKESTTLTTASGSQTNTNTSQQQTLGKKSVEVNPTVDLSTTGVHRAQMNDEGLLIKQTSPSSFTLDSRPSPAAI